MLRYNSCTDIIKYLDRTDLQKIRMQSGISRAVMARALGVSPRSVRAWEREDTHPRDSRIMSAYARVIYALEQHLKITQ